MDVMDSSHPTRAPTRGARCFLPATPVPTPAVSSNSAVVGLFEGAHYHFTGWFRPKLTCKMRALGVAFCEVCSETLVKSIYGQIRPIEATSPATNNEERRVG